MQKSVNNLHRWAGVMRDLHNLILRRKGAKTQRGGGFGDGVRDLRYSILTQKPQSKPNSQGNEELNREWALIELQDK